MRPVPRPLASLLLIAGLALGASSGIAQTPPASQKQDAAGEIRQRHPVAVFAGLDKITGRIISFEAAIDETVQFGSLQMTARVCFTRDSGQRTSTFIEVEEIGGDNQYKRIFSGWMLAQSPGLNAIEHPVYDVWLTDCKGEAIEKVTLRTEIEEEEPVPNADLKKLPRPATAQPIGPRGTGAPLRLPDGTAAGGVPLPPGGLPPRQAPQQRFFPTNAPTRGYDPAAGSGR